MAQQQDRVVQGTVAAINDRGVKVGDTWFNWSKFADVEFDKPAAGDAVELLVRQDKWVQGCKILGDPGDMGERGWVGDGELVPAGAQDDDPSTWGYGATGSQAAARAPSLAAAPRPAQAAPPAPVARPTSAPGAKTSSRATLRAAALAASAHFHSGRSAEEGAEADVYAQAWRFLAWIEDDEA